MKRCTYCAEEVREEAIVCPHCGRALLVQAARLSQLGRLYAIGKTDKSYGIWNMITGGSPVEEFEISDLGWKKAWQAYAKAERSAAPTQGGGWLVGGFVSFDT